MQDRLLTPTETAARYGISVRQLFTLERKGQIPPAVRLNQRVLRFEAAQHPAPLAKR